MGNKKLDVEGVDGVVGQLVLAVLVEPQVFRGDAELGRVVLDPARLPVLEPFGLVLGVDEELHLPSVRTRRSGK